MKTEYSQNINVDFNGDGVMNERKHIKLYKRKRHGL